MQKEKIVDIIIMAAGEGSRMGEIKQLLPWKDSNLLVETIKKAKASSANAVHVVLGANADHILNECKSYLQGEINVILNRNWANGLGNSISHGVSTIIKENKNIDAILVCLADQPLVTTSYLNEIIAIFKETDKKIIATKYKKRPGVPALFDASVHKDLIKLDGDHGAKHIMEEFKNQMITLNGDAIILDIDTKTEYEQLRKKHDA